MKLVLIQRASTLKEIEKNSEPSHAEGTHLKAQQTLYMELCLGSLTMYNNIFCSINNH